MPYTEPSVWTGVTQSTNRPHNGAYIVYINGIEVPVKSVSQRYGVWQIPELQIEMVADPVLTRLGTEDRVQVAVFYLDDVMPDPSVTPQFRLFGEGEIVAWGYQNTPGGRSIVFTCVNQIAILTQLFVQFLTQVDDYAAFATNPNSSTFGTATSSIVFPYSLFTDGLLRTNPAPTAVDGAQTPEAGAAAAAPDAAGGTPAAAAAPAGVTGVSSTQCPNGIKRPFDFLFNVVKALLEKKIPAPVRTIPAANFFARWARLTNFVNRFAGFPVFDEVSDVNVFPALKALQDINAVDQLVQTLLPQIQNAGSLFDMLQLVYQQVCMEIAMIPTMPLVRVNLKTRLIESTPFEEHVLRKDTSTSSTKYIAKTPTTPQQPNVIPNYFSKPQFLFGLPPSCNVIFPSQIKMFSYQENFATQPTRLYFNDSVIVNLFRAGGTAMGTQISNALATGYPPEVDVGNQASLVTNAQVNGKNFLLFPEEFFKGPVMDRRPIPPWLFFLKQAEYKAKGYVAPGATPAGTPTVDGTTSTSGQDEAAAATTTTAAAAQQAQPDVARPPKYADRRANAAKIPHPRPPVAGIRDWRNITGVTLHQTGCALFGEGLPRWDSLIAHFGITRGGQIIQCFDLTEVVNHAEWFNNHDVGIEQEGYFEGIAGTPRTLASDVPHPAITPTSEQVEAAKAAVRYIVALVASHGGKVSYIHAHRQTKESRLDDPGSALWQQVAIPLMKELGLSDGGRGYCVRDGRPIPEGWDARYTGITYEGTYPKSAGPGWSPVKPVPGTAGGTVPGPAGIDMNLLARLKAEDENVYELYAKYEYFRERYEKRTGSAILSWNPYVVPGFPAAFFDQRATRVDVFAYITTVQQRMSARDRQTDISFVYGRTIQEVFDLLRHEFALGSTILGNAPKEPIKDVRKVLQSFTQAESMYQSLFYGGRQLFGKDASFDWRKIIGYAPTTATGTPEAIFMEGKEEGSTDAYHAAAQTVVASQPQIETLSISLVAAKQKLAAANDLIVKNTNAFASVAPQSAIPAQEPSVLHQMFIDSGAQVAADNLKAADDARMAALGEIAVIETQLLFLRGQQNAALATVHATEADVSVTGVGVVHNVTGDREIVPLPSAESMFREYDAAMAYNWRPICTLDEYIIFHDSAGEEAVPATGNERSLGARYFGRIRRMTALKRGFHFPIGADGFQKVPDGAVEMTGAFVEDEPTSWTPVNYVLEPEAQEDTSIQSFGVPANTLTTALSAEQQEAIIAQAKANTNATSLASALDLALLATTQGQAMTPDEFSTALFALEDKMTQDANKPETAATAAAATSEAMDAADAAPGANMTQVLGIKSGTGNHGENGPNDFPQTRADWDSILIAYRNNVYYVKAPRG